MTYSDSIRMLFPAGDNGAIQPTSAPPPEKKEVNSAGKTNGGIGPEADGRRFHLE